ncbi:MAG: RNA methyltransferase [Elusimicrobiota bacterium]
MPGSLDIRFVLVRPCNALNMGAAARAMSNFGFSDLVVVEPNPPQWRKAHSAIYGSELLARAPVRSLPEALADRHLVLGTASAHNRAQRCPMLTLPALRSWITRRLPRGGRAAVLFGAERTGLSNAELDCCHALLRIPTCAEAPSMNLGQAVAVTAYELSKPRLERSAQAPDADLLEARQLDGLVETALLAMAKAGVNTHLGEASRRQKFRQGLMRWRMRKSDASWLRGLLARLIQKAA